MDLGAFFSSPWSWLILAACLFVVEMLIGSTYLLWVSAAAFLTAGIVALTPDAGVAVHALSFGGLALALTVVGKRYLKNPLADSAPLLNDPNARLIGASAIALEDFAGNRGRVKIGDSEWAAEIVDSSEAPAAGTALKVRQVDGATLKVGRS